MIHFLKCLQVLHRPILSFNIKMLHKFCPECYFESEICGLFTYRMESYSAWTYQPLNLQSWNRLTLAVL